MTRTALLTAAVLLIVADRTPHAQRGSSAEAAQSPTASALVPTSHPVLPRDLSRLWFAPRATGSGASAPSGEASPFAAAMKLADREDYGKALPLLSQPQAQQGPLGEYALYYAGLAELRLGHHERARALFKEIQERRPIGYLAEAAALGEAECAEAANDYAGAVAIYERLSGARTTAPDEVLLKLGGAAKAAGDLKTAAEAFGRVLYEFPLSSSAPIAEAEYVSLPGVAGIAAGTRRFELELGRAERLFGSRRYPEARKVFEALRPAATGDTRELVDLRLAECDYYQRRFRNARDRVKPYTERASRQGEALYFYAVSVADLGDRATYLKTVRRIVDEFPTQTWAEEALNNLATRHIVADEDDQADTVFRELYAKYPRGAYGDRAAWRVGWRSYRQGRFAETVSYFDRAAADFPRSDYRPTWLYWSGRAHERLKAPAVARARFELTAADYLNSYYGRLAVKRLDGRVPLPRVVGTPTSVLPPPPNEALIRTLLGIGRYDDALNELRYAQRAWGDSPAIQATVAFANRQKGLAAAGSEQFTLLRGSITVMRRAYPQFMAAGGEQLPREILTMIFPLSYWDLIQKYSALNKLDPYMVAALVAQESTFVPDIRSSAGAVGLMQLMTPTARLYARRFKLPYSNRIRTTAEPNLRIGTAYLADKIGEFGGLHLALAGYNAGERAVHRWIDERPGLTDTEEFIDDIPYAETQNYVKRIIGTAEDYRRLYGSDETN